MNLNLQTSLRSLTSSKSDRFTNGSTQPLQKKRTTVSYFTKIHHQFVTVFRVKKATKFQLYCVNFSASCLASQTTPCSDGKSLVQACMAMHCKLQNVASHFNWIWDQVREFKVIVMRVTENKLVIGAEEAHQKVGVWWWCPSFTFQSPPLIHHLPRIFNGRISHRKFAKPRPPPSPEPKNWCLI